MSGKGGAQGGIKPDPGAQSETQQQDAPADSNAAQQLELTIKSQDGTVMKFRVKAHTPFQKVFHAWGQRRHVDEKTYRFITEGNRVHPHQTPQQVGIENGDIIDAFIMQEGGSGDPTER